MSAAEAATEVVAEVAEEVGEQAYALAESSRNMSGRLGLVFTGFVVGAGAGAAGAYFVIRKKLETKYAQISAQEIAEMREHYQDKVVSFEGQQTKPQLEALVREKGYTPPEDITRPPMAVTPPDAVVDAAEAAKDDQEPNVETDPTRLTKDVAEEPENQRVFDRSEPQPVDGWDYHTERARRSPLRPYVIHIDEKDENQAYDSVTFTYYEADDVLCNEQDEVISDREQLIGEANLEKFGHGSGDPSIVYIRNDRMETVIELVRSPNSYAEEVHGFQHSDDYPRPRRRRSFDDE